MLTIKLIIIITIIITVIVCSKIIKILGIVVEINVLQYSGSNHRK